MVDSKSNGILVNSDSSSLTIASSTISATRDGVRVTNSANINIQGSTFTGNRRGIFVNTPADEASILIRNNNFYGNNAFDTLGHPNPFAGIQYADADALTAENNWWGSSSGPITTDDSSSDPIDAAYSTGGGTIDYDPFAANIFTILPSNL